MLDFLFGEKRIRVITTQYTRQMYTHARKNPNNGFTETLRSELKFIKGWKRVK